MPTFTRRSAALALALSAAVGSLPVRAAEQVRIIMPFAAGGASDVLARMVAERMQRSTGNTVVVENIVGANGNIGAAAAARAAADGRTLLITSEAYTTVNPLLFKDSLGYTPADLEPLSILAIQPAVLTVKAGSPIKNYADFIQKARTSGVTYSSAGVGATSHLATQYLASLVGGLKLTHVPYKGGAPAINAVLAGDVDAGFIVSGNVIPHLTAGKLSALAIASGKRLAQMPNVPTVEELEKREFTVENAVVLLVPSRTPQDVKDRIAAESRKAVDTPEVGAYLDKNGYLKVNSSGAEAQRWLSSEKKRWTELITVKNIARE
ncbi:MAG: tripartite tricarboxylate transporter substrate binding protein [Burkholderiales bacterium]|nr:tripartite tricarboxylate transporter substrate binding protein [Burkholderiales bacterium]